MNIFEKIFSSPKHWPSEEEKKIVRQRLSEINTEGQTAPAETAKSTPPQLEAESEPRLTQEERQALKNELIEKTQSLSDLRQWHKDYTAEDKEMDTNYEKEIEAIRKKLNASENI